MDTIRIKSSHPPSQGPFVVIDASDYDPAKHELWGVPPPVHVLRTSPHFSEPSEPTSIPDNWRGLSWQEKRALVAKVSDDPVINEAQADAVLAAATGDANENAIPDDWEKLPWFSLRQRVKQETGTSPKNKLEAIRLMKAHSAETGS